METLMEPQVNAKGPIGDYVRNHKRMLSVFGAFIVFITFVVNEGIRDRLKDDAERMANAEQTFVDGMNSSRLAMQLSFMPNQITIVDDENNKNKKSENALLRIVESEATARLLANSVDSSANNFLRFTHAIPKHKFLDDKFIEGLMNSLNTFEQDKEKFYMSSLVKLVRTAPDGKAQVDSLLHSHPDQVTPYLGDVEQEFAKVRSEGQMLLLAIDNLSSNAMSDAEEAKRTADRKYSLARWISYGFYVLGWGLTFIGRVYGVDNGE